MKKIYQLFSALALSGMLMTGCTDQIKFGDSFIEKAPGGTTNLDSIFSNIDYANQFLTAIYARQYYGLPYNNDAGNSSSPYTGKLDAVTDLCQIHWSGCAVWSRYYTATMTANNLALIGFTNDNVWETVRLVWMFIENIDRVPDLTKEKRDYMVAQAKMLLANRYFDLLPHYGGLPIVNHAFGTTESVTAPRATFAETVDSIVSWCDQAAPYLPWAYNGNTADTNSLQTGRWTKAGAMALKAKVLWLAASPLFNNDKPYYGGTTEAETQHLVWYGDYQQSRWERALKAFEDFWTENTANGDYWHLEMPSKSTCDAYRVAYRRGYILDDSRENIHWTKVADYYGTQGTYAWLNWNSWSVNRLNMHPSVEYLEMFPWSDGRPFNRATDMTLERTDVINEGEPTEQTWDVYTCLQGSGSTIYDNLFYQYKGVRGGIAKTASRDPRLYENAVVTGQQKMLDFSKPDGVSSGDIQENWVGGNDASYNTMNADGTLAESLTSLCPLGTVAYKYVLSQAEYWRDHDMHWNVLTIPDVILMYAECLAECGRLTDAIAQVDKIRSRVGMKSLNYSYNSSLNLTSNKENLIEEILRERACELGLTNARYIDMVRRMRTDWMTKQLHGLATYRMTKNSSNQWVRRLMPYKGDDKNSGVIEPCRFEYQIFDIIQGKRALWDLDPNSPEVKKWLMSPFPQSEINKQYGLIQNPGW